MSESDLNAQLQQAIALARSGSRDDARALLESIVSDNPNLETAWLWLASVSDDKTERIGYLKQALAINPHNPTTQQAYAQLTGQYGEGEPVKPLAVPGAEERPDHLIPSIPLTRGNWLILMGLVALAVVVIVIILNNRGNDTEPKAKATPTPQVIIPAFSPTPFYSLTPSNTPWPTRTPGPSPTPVTLPPTWTPSPSWTPRPTQTSVPSWTPRPSATLPPTALPLTATFTLLPEVATKGTDTPVPHSTDTPEPLEDTPVQQPATDTPLPTDSPTEEVSG